MFCRRPYASLLAAGRRSLPASRENDRESSTLATTLLAMHYRPYPKGIAALLTALSLSFRSTNLAPAVRALVGKLPTMMLSMLLC